MDREFHVESDREDSVTLVTVTGEVDLATAPELEERLGEAVAAGDTTADLVGVEFMDSTGLRVLIAAHEAADAAGHSFSLVVAEGPVTRLLRITGVDQQLTVRMASPDVGEA
jgi:anti-sigma B factor antagonist